MIILAIIIVIVILGIGFAFVDGADALGAALILAAVIGLFATLGISTWYTPGVHTDDYKLQVLDSGDYVKVIDDRYIFTYDGETVNVEDDYVTIKAGPVDSRPRVEVTEHPTQFNKVWLEIGGYTDYTLYIPTNSVEVVD